MYSQRSCTITTAISFYGYTLHTHLQLPEEVQPGCGLHLLRVKVEGENEDGDDHRGHDCQRNLVHHTAGGQHTQMLGLQNVFS